jgi:RNA polymerase sigma factor (sigma-70 family)
MITDDIELLRRYVATNCEDSFAELVRLHIDLVYSAALRLVYDDPSLAEDVTQAVFSDLAQKASRLTAHSSLAGWLYTSTRFVAANARRTESRRRAREQKVYAMNQLIEPADRIPDCDQLRFMLDEAMHQLSQSDREAILLRYFEQRPLNEVGKRLDLSENAARMRVERAVERLRFILIRAGVTSAAALTAVLGEQVVRAAPKSLAATVSRKALVSLKTTVAIGNAGVFTLLMSAKIKIVVGVLLVLLLLTPSIVRNATKQRSPSNQNQNQQVKTLPANLQPKQKVRVPETSQVSNLTNALFQNTNTLRLTLVTGDSGMPVPGVEIELNERVQDSFKNRKFIANRVGLCVVDFSDDIQELELIASSEGFADTRLKWKPEQGEKIPASLTIRLARAVLIGGVVLSPENRPVEGATVEFGYDRDFSADRVDIHNFRAMGVKTGPDGRWRINRIAEDTIARIHGNARHSDYLSSPEVSTARDARVLEQLRAETHTFHLGRGLVVQGIVVNSRGEPISDSRVLVGHHFDAEKLTAKTGNDGMFTIAAVIPGPNLISAEAPGYAASTKQIEVKENAEPVRLELKPGRILRLRVVDVEGRGIPNANVSYETSDRGPVNPGNSQIAIQTDFDARTDAEGRVVWENAPDGELLFSAQARGYMFRDPEKVQSDDEEHLIKLGRALILSGTVRDATSGKMLPAFRIVSGSPGNRPQGEVHWNSSEEDRLKFFGGAYRHSFDVPLSRGGGGHPTFVFKFESDGYAPFQSRIFDPNEGEVHLDVNLKPGRSATVTVLTPAGLPAIAADVGFVAPGAALRLNPGGFSRLRGAGGIFLLKTDGNGRFHFTFDDSVSRVIVVSTEGYISVAPGDLNGDPAIQLQPWGRLEVACRNGDQAAPGLEYKLQFPEPRLNEIDFDSESFKVTSDQNGHVLFSKVPPGIVKLTRLKKTGPSSWRYGEKTDVAIKPGETTQITVRTLQ